MLIIGLLSIQSLDLAAALSMVMTLGCLRLPLVRVVGVDAERVVTILHVLGLE